MATARALSDGIRQQALAALAEYFIEPAAALLLYQEELLVPVIKSFQARVDTAFPSTRVLVNYRRLDNGSYQLGYVLIDTPRARGKAKGVTIWLE